MQNESIDDSMALMAWHRGTMVVKFQIILKQSPSSRVEIEEYVELLHCAMWNEARSEK